MFGQKINTLIAVSTMVLNSFDKYLTFLGFENGYRDYNPFLNWVFAYFNPVFMTGVFIFSGIVFISFIFYKKI